MKRHLANIAFMTTALSVALGSYLVSARVAAERAAVEGLKGAIQADMEDIQGLEAELRIRSRLPQLERWNREVLALQAPQAGQFARDSLHLAALARPVLPGGDPTAGPLPAAGPVPAPVPAPVPGGGAAAPVVRVAARGEAVAGGPPAGPDAMRAAPQRAAGTRAPAAARAAGSASAPAVALPPVLAAARPGAPLRPDAPTLLASAVLPAPAGAVDPAAGPASDLGLAIAAELDRLPAPPAGQ